MTLAPRAKPKKQRYQSINEATSFNGILTNDEIEDGRTLFIQKITADRQAAIQVNLSRNLKIKAS
jgi:hypothetical protein